MHAENQGDSKTKTDTGGRETQMKSSFGTETFPMQRAEHVLLGAVCRSEARLYLCASQPAQVSQWWTGDGRLYCRQRVIGTQAGARKRRASSGGVVVVVSVCAVEESVDGIHSSTVQFLVTFFLKSFSFFFFISVAKNVVFHYF